MKLETVDSREELESELEALKKEYEVWTPAFWTALYDAVWLFIRAEKEKHPS
jgi:hypothetical protein